MLKGTLRHYLDFLQKEQEAKHSFVLVLKGLLTLVLHAHLSFPGAMRNLRHASANLMVEPSAKGLSDASCPEEAPSLQRPTRARTLIMSFSDLYSRFRMSTPWNTVGQHDKQDTTNQILMEDHFRYHFWIDTWTTWITCKSCKALTALKPRFLWY